MMERLTHREMARLLEAAAILSASVEPADLMPRIFAAIKQVVATEIIGIDAFDPQGRHLGENWLDPVDCLTPDDLQIFARHAPQHPLFKEFASNGLSTPLRISDVASAGEFQRTEVYNEFYRKVGVERQLVVGLAVNRERAVLVALSRIKRDFTEGNRRLLAALRPHLLNALRNTGAFAQIQRQIEQLQTAFAASGDGLIIFDAQGRMLLITDIARVLIGRYFGNPHGRADCLPEDLARWLKSCAPTASHNGGSVSPVAPLEISRGASRLSVRLLNDRASGQHMLLLEEKRDAAFDLTALEAFGLTRREHEVLAWLAQGKTNAEIALLCDVRPRTVEKHVEHIYQKLGVETRTAVMRLACGI